MKIAAYGRVSTKDKGQVVDNQLRQMRELAAKQDWEIVHEYVDRKTGKDSDRDQFNQLFEDASKRRFDMILFWSLDRFTREGALKTLLHLERLLGYCVAFRSYTEQYLDSLGIFGDAVIAILAVIAKQERLRISERTLAGMERARAEGKCIGRPKAKVDRDLVLTLRASGKSFGEIATELDISKPLAFRICKQQEAAVS